MPRSLLRVLLSALFLVACLVTWRVLEAQGWLEPEQIQRWLTRSSELSDSPWLVPVLVLTYALGLLVMFPLTLLVITTGLLFGPVWGLFYATLGTVASSVLSFWVGHWIGRDALSRYTGSRVARLNQYLADRGVRTMVLINLLPVAPFTLTNLLAGASHIPFSHYLIGSVIGIVPGLAAVTLMGSQLGTLLAGADTTTWVRAALIVLACLAFLGAMTRLAKKRSAR